MKPRGLFVTDLDGTLVSFETGELPARNREAIRRATEAGIVVAVATGRRRSSFRAARSVLHGLSYRTSLSNGAVLLADDNDTPRRIHSFPWDGALRLARIAGEGIHAMLAITAPVSGELADCWVFRPDGAVFAAGSPWAPDTHVAATQETARAQPLVHAALHVASRERAEELEPRARGIFAGEAVEIHSVRSPGGGGALLEVVVEGGKGRAVRDLAGELGLAPERTGAIGDDMNDARLLEAAGHRYAVGGSVLSRRRPDAVAVGRAEEGAVAQALEAFARALRS